MVIETQQMIGAWGNKTFGPARAIVAGKRAAVEMGELIEALESDPDAKLDATQEEAADVLIVLFRLADVAGFNLLAAVSRKMQVNRSRKWTVNGDGSGDHVKEG